MRTRGPVVPNQRSSRAWGRRAEPASATGAPHEPSGRCRRIAAGRRICVTAEKGQQPPTAGDLIPANTPRGPDTPAGPPRGSQSTTHHLPGLKPSGLNAEWPGTATAPGSVARRVPATLSRSRTNGPDQKRGLLRLLSVTSHHRDCTRTRVPPAPGAGSARRPATGRAVPGQLRGEALASPPATRDHRLQRRL